MPTYNSESTIERALVSIREQIINQKMVEILVIDGGSHDKTLEIAKKYHCRIIFNENRLPEPAKLLGLQEATGKYICFLDSDESFINKSQLLTRLDLFKEFPKVGSIMLDKYISDHKNIAVEYCNNLGDPFTAFIYNLRCKNNFHTFRYAVSVKKNNFAVFDTVKFKFAPIADAGSTMFITSKLLAVQNHDSIVRTIKNYFEKNQYIGIVKNDFIKHDSALTVKVYLKKINFRIINNVHYPENSGYSARNKNISIKSLAFLFYCLLPFFPLVDAAIFSIRTKRVAMIIHVFFVYYLFLELIKQYTYKLAGYHPTISQYGQ